MNKCKINRRLYKIHRYDFLKLIQSGKVENETLVCNESVTLFAEILKQDQIDLKGECQLFDQCQLAYPELADGPECFEKIFINMSFASFVDYKSYQEPGALSLTLKRIRNGIDLIIKCEKIHFVDFYKSNSMSKNACIYYINEKYLEKLEPRLAFGFNKGKLVLPKWYAYSGLALSDAVMLKGVCVKRDEIAVIPDSEQATVCNCITGISVKSLFEKIDDLRSSIKQLMKKDADINCTLKDYLAKFDPSERYVNRINTSVYEFVAYEFSKDLNRIKNDKDVNPYISYNKTHIVKMIETINDALGNNVDKIIATIDDLMEKYKNFEYDLKDYVIANGGKPSKEVYWERFYVENFPCVINKFDGEGLMSNEFRIEAYQALKERMIAADDENDEEDDDDDVLNLDNINLKKQKFFSLQIRLPYMKGVIHCCDLQGFFKEKGIKYIYGLTFNQTPGSEKLHRYDASKIKVLLTKSQFKAASFIAKADEYENEKGSRFDNFIDKVNEYNYSLGIAGAESPTWNKANLNYQFLSTIPFPESSVNDIIAFNKDELKYKLSEENIVDNIIRNQKASSFEDEIFKDYRDFYISTKRFKDRRKDYVNALKRTLLRMKLGTEGYRKYLCSDLLELLYHCAYHNSDENPKIDFLQKYEFFAPNTNLDKYYSKFAVLRNPHYSRNEIAIMKPFKNKESERYKYFGHLTGVLMINPLSFVANRLGGADYDGDTVLILNDKHRQKYIDALGENPANVYPIVDIPSLLTGTIDYSYDNKMECLENTFNSRVGLISNYAFHSALDNYDINNDHSDYGETPFFTILSGLEIDSAKKGIKPYLPTRKANPISGLFIKLKGKLDNKIKFEQKELDQINEYADQHPIFYLCKSIIDFDDKKELPTIESKKLTYNSDLVSENYFEKIVAVTYVYNKIVKRLRGLKSNKNKIADEGLRSNIQNILVAKGIDNVNFLSEFDVVNPFATLSKYCNSDIKFHYLTNKVDKLNFIYEVLGINKLSEEVEDIICDFSNNGCYLLYFILNHFKICFLSEMRESGALINIADNELEKKAYSAILKGDLYDNLTQEQLDCINQNVRELVMTLNVLVKDLTNSDEIEKASYENLSSYAKDIPFDNYLYMKGNADAGIVFTILSENLLNYLKQEKDGE